MENKSVLKAAIYCRLSRDDGFNDESESITNQKMLLTEYCLKMDWNIYGIYCDDDYSGLDITRPEFNKLINDAKKRNFDIVVCKNQSRFSRDMEVIEKYIHYFFPIWGIRFIGVVDNTDTLNKSGKKARQINGLINEWYCEDISENVKAALNIKKRNGQYLGHWCPYGYRLMEGNNKKLDIDPMTYWVVKRIFNEYCNGKSIRLIAYDLTKDGIKTPYEYKKSIGINYFNPSVKSENNNCWSTETVRKILKDKTYTGSLIQCREKKESYKSQKVILSKPDEWIEVENCHEAVIDIKTFEKAQEIMALKRRKSKQNSFDLKGKVYCADCDSALGINNSHGVLYLRCPKSVRKENCRMKSIKYSDIEKAVKENIKMVLNQGDLCKRLENRFRHVFECKSICDYESYEKNVKRANAAKNALAKAYMDLSVGKITQEEFEFIRNRLKSETEFYKEKINRQKPKDKKIIMDILNEINKNIDFNIINSFIKRIEIKNDLRDEVITIYWRF